MDHDFHFNLENYSLSLLEELRMEEENGLDETYKQATLDIINKLMNLDYLFKSGNSSWREIEVVIKYAGGILHNLKVVGNFFTTFLEIMKQVGGFSRKRALKIFFE
jgi:hypothetical protein